jgi:hypothetical protein
MIMSILSTIERPGRLQCPRNGFQDVPPAPENRTRFRSSITQIGVDRAGRADRGSEDPRKRYVSLRGQRRRPESNPLRLLTGKQFDTAHTECAIHDKVSLLCTDQWAGYNKLGKEYPHLKGEIKNGAFIARTARTITDKLLEARAAKDDAIERAAIYGKHAKCKLFKKNR